MKIYKRTAALMGLAATTLFCTGGLVACDSNQETTVYGPPSYFGMEDSEDAGFTEKPSIRSEWKIESWTTNGETGYPLEGEDESVLPRFHSDDGKSFFLTITGEKEYRGDLVLMEDGTYQLKYEDNPNVLTAKIDGKKLTITLPSGSGLTFVTE